MATRSNIAVLVKPEDLNKVLNVFDENRFDVEDMPYLSGRSCTGFSDGIPICPEEMSMEEVYKNANVIVDAGAPYLQIYVHYDGYPEHMIPTLLNNFNSYDKALALVLAGDASSINEKFGDVVCYAYEDGFESTRPAQQDMPTLDEEYLYIFKDDKWYIDVPEGYIPIDKYFEILEKWDVDDDDEDDEGIAYIVL